MNIGSLCGAGSVATEVSFRNEGALLDPDGAPYFSQVEQCILHAILPALVLYNTHV
jgi:hypothetical protein